MVPARAVDCGEIYDAVRREFLELVRALSASELDENVPSTPEWSVRDVLAHLVGITADLNAEDFGTDPEGWTAAQVRSRRGRTIDELAAEWDREALQFEEGLRLLGYEIGSHYIGDLLQHVADVRHALGRSRPADNEALAVAVDFYLVSFEETLVSEGLGSVAVTVGHEHWALGTGATVASLSAERFELFRSLGGRAAEQIRALDWSGDYGPILPAISRYPIPATPMIEAR